MLDDPENRAIASDQPDIDYLCREFRRAGTGGDYWNRVRVAEDTRLNRWPGQSDDGKKHDNQLAEGQPAVPFDGANDSRVYMADDIINEGVAIDTTAFWRADLKVSNVTPNVLDDAGQATTFLSWLRDVKLRSELEEEVELFSQYREVSYESKTVKLDELIQTAQQVSQADPSKMTPEQKQIIAVLSVFPEAIQNPEMRKQAVDLMQFLYRTYVMNSMPEHMTEDDLPNLSTQKAGQFVDDLRQHGETEIPFPYLCKNQPIITALKPWRDIFVPTDTAGFQNARLVTIRWHMTEAFLMSQVLSNEWDEEFVELALNTKGRTSIWNYSDVGMAITTSISQWGWLQQQTEMIEILCSYQKQIDENGVLSVYYTIYSPYITDDTKKVSKAKRSRKFGSFSGGEIAPVENSRAYAKHGLLNYPQSNGYPIVLSRREHLDRQLVAARGIPEILITQQREQKVMHDAIVDHTNVTVGPPLFVPQAMPGQRYDLTPFAQNKCRRGAEPTPLELPTGGLPVAVNFLDYLDRKNHRYFGQFSEEVPPAVNQAKIERDVRGFLSAWGQAFQQCYQLALKFAPELIERVTGMKPQTVNDAQAAELDFIFHYDIAHMNPETFEQKLKLLSQVKQQDQGNVINGNKLTSWIARAIDPMMARELIQPEQIGNAMTMKEVSDDIMAMFLGNPPNIRDMKNDATAPSRLNMAKQVIMSNPKYMQALDPKLLQQLAGQQLPAQMMQQLGIGQHPADPFFSNGFSQYMANIQFGVQEQQNKQTGVTGVKAPQQQLGQAA
jgi:hypothetical protein